MEEEARRERSLAPGPELRRAAEKYNAAIDDDSLVVARPGQVFEICKHKKLECDECNLSIGQEFVPPECDNRGGA